jgi:YD repeat-containing protein
MRRGKKILKNYFRLLAISTISLFAISHSHSALAGTTQYYYDALGRVIGAYQQSGTGTYYAYDAAGNRTNYQSISMIPPTSVDRLLANQSLIRGAQLTSPNSQYAVVLQTDGNLVLYSTTGALWSTNTGSSQAALLFMQSNGDLVLFNPNTTTSAWDAKVTYPNSYAVIQDDGNFVIYDASNIARWATNTAGGVSSPGAGPANTSTPSPGGPQVTLNTTGWGSDQTGQSIQTTADIVVGVSSGTAPYTYVWKYISGDTLTSVSNSSSSDVYWTRSQEPDIGPGVNSMWQCTVIDATGKVGFSPQVTVHFENDTQSENDN